MSLNNLQLPEQVIRELYRTSLVDLSGADNIKNAANKEIDFYGGNRQRIIILVNAPGTAYIADEQLSFLTGILAACKLNLEDTAIVNVARYPGLDYKKISTAMSPLIVMMFGVLPADIELPFVMPDFQRQSYNNQVYLSAPSLTDIANDREMKKKLWTTLQQIFSM